MGHLRDGSSPVHLARLVVPSCIALLLLAGCGGGGAHAAPRPAFAFPATAAAEEPNARRERLRAALDTASARVGQALEAMAEVTPASYDDGPTSTPLATMAREDCAELLEEALALLAGAGAPGAARGDALAWLSAALTNHDTCADGLAEAASAVPGGQGAGPHHAHLAAARATVRDSLAMYASTTPKTSTAARTDDASASLRVRDGRGSRNATTKRAEDACGFPRWLPARDRRLLLHPAASLAARADIVVAKDGTGTHATIADAVRAAPECSERRTVIHVKAGVYRENVKVGMKKTNLVFVGDGKGVTVVTGNRSVADGNYTTFRTATFAASGSGFMMRDMTVENRAGPVGRQAVALRVSADRAAVHRCGVAGYQDALYAHSNRQFYRDCDVRGTVDAVFGNAAAVLQRCTLRARAPQPGQQNTVTAQGRSEPCQRTGIVLHACRLVPAPDLAGRAAQTYLGRPWRPYSRVVVMESYIGDHVAPRGWLEWNASAASALGTLYYGEYMNHGPGAGVAGRVPWPGHRVINSTAEAERFTVARFIAGASWLPGTGVSFDTGLSL
ncbi:hypothetical protein PAHAL_1G131400 [Panicum hallii]|uniref:Pectinesterase n=1 Tax=Panicum hallii TaxID=206008 RepID=A0A2S3GNK6_9POAL|nr:pectinesterase-like [Panicum hallii]PAN05325.1 hypothetical protein PAHAL_1G131400 [Panicum hallii]